MDDSPERLAGREAVPGAAPKHGVFRQVAAALRMRCPRCCDGAVWGAPFRMHDRCPVCGLAFEREPGYFTGAMYASYFIGIFATLPAWLWMLLAGATLVAIMAVVIAMMTVLTPLAFHYSRVAWMHIDYVVNPSTFVEDVPW